jgi:hypothetical protein
LAGNGGALLVRDGELGRGKPGSNVDCPSRKERNLLPTGKLQASVLARLLLYS